jgi:hypothetical protein
MELKPARSMAEFFQEALSAALRNQALSASQLTEFYLVNLLEEFARWEIDEQPLGLKLAQAMNESPEARARQLKEVGDTSLCISVFFGERLEYRSVTIDYYIAMGGSAYAALAALLRMSRRGETMGEVYGELAEKFPRFVDVLAEVSERGAFGSNRGVLHLYERWIATGSDRIARKLRAQGLVPPRGGEKH